MLSKAELKTKELEVVLPTHRDDIFGFLKVFKPENRKLSREPKDFSSPLGAVMSQ